MNSLFLIRATNACDTRVEFGPTTIAGFFVVLAILIPKLLSVLPPDSRTVGTVVNAELEDSESTDCEIKGTLVIRRSCGMDPGVTCILTVLIPVGIRGTRGVPLVRGVVGILPVLKFLSAVSGTRRASSRLKKYSIVVNIVACIDIERALTSTCNPDSSDGKVSRGGALD